MPRTCQIVFAALLGGQLASPALAGCPAGEEGILFHSCAGPASMELLLLPEEAGAVPPPPQGESLTVTGAYTGADTRAGGRPNPVGFFIDNGRVVSPNLARMDGILVIGSDGQPQLHRSTAVPLGGKVADLTDPDERLLFAGRAAERGVSVMQSHLLISEGGLDVRPGTDAPIARRRLLFTGADGWGVYQTAEAVTLFDAAEELLERHGPEMALNLDMGSFDYCIATTDRQLANCGVLAAPQTEKLSNLLRFARPAS